MSFDRIAVIGVDCISASMALGLKKHKPTPEVVGYDENPFLAELAQKKGAFDRIVRQLGQAVSADTDLVIVSVPLSKMRETFTVLASRLPAGCLVTDTARLKAPVMQWAAELLPEDVCFVGGHVLPNPALVGLRTFDDVEEADAQLLNGALYCFTVPSHLPETIVARLAELAERLAAQPFFIDVTEHDGLEAGIGDLPDLLAVALLLATVGTPGWQEMRKFAGQRFAAATESVEAGAEHRLALFLNRENLLLRLNALLLELIRLRELLKSGDIAALEEVCATAAALRADWLEQLKRGLWGPENLPSMADVPTAGERIGRLFVGERLFEQLRRIRAHPQRE